MSHEIIRKDDFLVRSALFYNNYAESDFCTHFRRSTFIKRKSGNQITMKYV